jgi:imidazolonepropionase-like amidohydrolase
MPTVSIIRCPAVHCTLISLTLIAACSPTGNEQSPPTAAEVNSSTTFTFDWWAGDTPAGETVIQRDGDGHIQNESFVHWNNREYKLSSTLKLDENGMVVAQTITGQSPFGAPIDESFVLENGQARWSTRGESGRAGADGPAFYVPTEWGASASIEALVRAAATRANGELPIYPAGAVRVTRQLEETVDTPDGEQRLSLYAIRDLDFQPQFAWFDDELNLVVRDFGRLGMVPRGWDNAIWRQLARVQAAEAARLIESASGEVARPLDTDVVIENVDVVDVVNGELLEDRHVLLADGIIRKISGSPIANENAQRLDASGQTLIPGLWDMHSHHGLDDGVLNIAGGVTSVRNLGATHERIVEQTEKFDSGSVIGPRTWRGAMIDQVGPYANRNPVRSVEEALEKIDEFAADGYMQIKLYSSIDPEWVSAIAERAHANGMRLSGHVPAFMSAEQAVQAGYDEIQHINMVFLNFLVGDEGDTRQQIRFTTYGSEGGQLDLDSAEVDTFIDLLIENEVTVDPTASIFDSMMRHVAGEPNPVLADVADHLPGNVRRRLYRPNFEIGEERLADWAATAVRQGEMVKKLYDCGVQLVAGTDAMAGFALHRELELYAQYGIPNADVLKIATIDSARIVGVDDRMGSVEEGKVADLVLLQGNPLDDISAVRRASWVFKGETAYRPDELYATVGVRPFGWSSTPESEVAKPDRTTR